MAVEKTFGMIKPNATAKNIMGKIIDKYETEGFVINKLVKTTLSTEKAQEFYAEHKERPFYGELVEFMTSGPVVLLELERENAVAFNREVMGATNPAEAKEGTIRQLWGDSLGENSVHGSDSLESASRELNFIFG